MIRLFHVAIPISVVLLIIADAVVLFGCLVVSAMFSFPDDVTIFLMYEGGLIRMAMFVAAMMLALYFYDMYNDLSITKATSLLSVATWTLGVTILSQSVIAYVLPGWIVPRSIVIVGGALTLVVLPIWRVLYHRHVAIIGRRSVLFLGTSTLIQDIAMRVSKLPQLGIRGLGFVDDDLAPGSQVAGLAVLGPVADLNRIVAETSPDWIVVGFTEMRGRLPVEELLRLRFAGMRIEEAASAFQNAFSRVPIKALRHSQLVFSNELDPLPRNLRLQTLYSRLLAAIGLVLMAPVMVLVGIAVRLTSPGPILFRQTRVGMGGKAFTIFKFRSMTADAEAKTGAVWATRNDPRITLIGGYLRKTRLDELPQLWNVLRGDMAIVGPRPERPEFVQVLTNLIPFYAHRHSVRPGITGWAQINYKYGESVEDTIVKLEYDLYYIKNLSPTLDAYIMFHTAKAMLASKLGQ